MKDSKRGPKTAEGDDTRIPVSMILSRETVDMLNEMARDMGVSRSQLVRHLIKKEYEHHEAIA